MKLIKLIISIEFCIFLVACTIEPTVGDIQTAMAKTTIATISVKSFPTVTSSSPSINNNSSSNSSNSQMWFSGGTLHKSTIKQWRNATYANRLATSADYVVGYLNITNFSDMTKIKQQATDLESCISKASEGGSADDEKVATIGAMCMVLLFPK